MTKYKAKKKIIGLTFGVFDLFHTGHLNLLINAKKHCDKLIVCVSTDVYSRKVKGYNPVIRFRDRMRIVNAINCVDDVGIQDIINGKKDAIKQYEPDIIFVGDDWSKDTFSGEKLGVKVKYLKYTSEISSTKIKKKICTDFSKEIFKK